MSLPSPSRLLLLSHIRLYDLDRFPDRSDPVSADSPVIPQIPRTFFC